MDELYDTLIAKGYKHTNFFYQTGGGEDEDDMEVFIKDDKAVTGWYSEFPNVRRCDAEDLNYIDGWPEYSEVLLLSDC